MTLFAIAINGMADAAGPSLATSLYVDGIAIYYSFRSIVTIERRRQGAVDRLSLLTQENDFCFLLIKLSVCISNA
jgi:hypothetical protein